MPGEVEQAFCMLFDLLKDTDGPHLQALHNLPHISNLFATESRMPLATNMVYVT